MFKQTLILSIAGSPWAALVCADVITSEFDAFPVDEGWIFIGKQGDVSTWLDDGVYVQDLPNNCKHGGVCDNEAYTRDIDQFNGSVAWFYEFRASGTSESSEIQNAAPVAFAAGNAFGNNYLTNLSADKIKLSGDADLPVKFVDVQPGPHTVRLELFNDVPPGTFRWYVDSVLELEGPADSVFPDFDARLVFQGRTWLQPTLNQWFYIRAGDIPVDGSADFNSDGAVDDFEVFYIEECIERSAAGEPADPSCSWADVTDADGVQNSVTCADWQTIATALWTGSGDPPPLDACPMPIPAVSHWGAGVLGFLMLSLATVAFRRSSSN